MSPLPWISQSYDIYLTVVEAPEKFPEDKILLEFLLGYGTLFPRGLRCPSRADI